MILPCWRPGSTAMGNDTGKIGEVMGSSNDNKWPISFSITGTDSTVVTNTTIVRLSRPPWEGPQLMRQPGIVGNLFAANGCAQFSLTASSPWRIWRVSVTLASFPTFCWMSAPRSRTETACGRLSAPWLAMGTTSSPRTRKVVSLIHGRMPIRMRSHSN